MSRDLDDIRAGLAAKSEARVGPAVWAIAGLVVLAGAGAGLFIGLSGGNEPASPVPVASAPPQKAAPARRVDQAVDPEAEREARLGWARSQTSLHGHTLRALGRCGQFISGKNARQIMKNYERDNFALFTEAQELLDADRQARRDRLANMSQLEVMRGAMDGSIMREVQKELDSIDTALSAPGGRVDTANACADFVAKVQMGRMRLKPYRPA